LELPARSAIAEAITSRTGDITPTHKGAQF
jgi:hypothetical protein